MNSFAPVDWSACLTSSSNIPSFSPQINGNDNVDAFNMNLPRLVIVEEPQEKFRFRYRSEMMGTHGCILGRRSDRLRKRYPEVKLINYTGGPAIIRCSLVAFLGNSSNPVPHAHRLTVRVQDVDQEEPQEIVVDDQTAYTAVFQGMGIVHTAKRYVVEELVKKKRRDLLEKVRGKRSNDSSLSVREEMQIKEEAQSEAKMMNLNIVNLCFEAYCKDMYGTLTPICDKVYSTPISNMKSAQTGELKICRIDKIDSSCLGGETIFILVEKVAKKNIMVRFFELDNDENGQEYEVWEDFGKFTELDVHHQYAVVFKTPRYRNINIDQPKDVFLQLYRPSDKDSSDPIKFTYKPRETVGRKRLRHQISYDTIPTAVVQGFSHQNETGLEAMLGFQPSSSDVNQAVNEKVQASSAVAELTTNLFPSVNSNVLNTPDELLGIRIEELLATQPENYSRELSLVSWDALNNLVMDCCPMEAFESHTKTLQGEIIRSDDGPEKGKKSHWRNQKTAFSEHLTRQIDEVGSNSDLLIRFLERRTFDGIMTLHLVVQHCKISLLERLLTIIEKKNAHNYLNKTNLNHQTCLHLAVMQKEWEKVGLLLRYGANPELKDRLGNTAYHLAISGQLNNGTKNCAQNRCIEELLNQKNYERSRFQVSNLNIYNEAGLTPLHKAVENEDLAAVEALVRANCDVNCFDIHGGCSALYMAILAGNTQIVRILLSHPTIDVDYCCRRKMNPLKLTSLIHGRNSEIMSLLKEKMNISDESASQLEEDDSSDDERESPSNEDQTEKSYSPQQLVDPGNETTLYADFHVESDSSLILEEEVFSFISDILDKSGKWKDVAKFLEYDFLVLAIQEHSSPTRSLLSYADVQNDVCMAKMKEILKRIGEERAADKIGRMMLQK